MPSAPPLSAKTSLPTAEGNQQIPSPLHHLGHREPRIDRTGHLNDVRHLSSLENEENIVYERKASLIQRGSVSQESETAANVRKRDSPAQHRAAHRVNAFPSQQHIDAPELQRSSLSSSRDSRPEQSIFSSQTSDTPPSYYSAHSYVSSRGTSEPHWKHSNASYPVNSSYHRPSYRHSMHSPSSRMFRDSPHENMHAYGEPSGSDTYDMRQGGMVESGNFYQYQHQHMHHHYIERRRSPTSLPECAIPVPLEYSPKIGPQGASRPRYSCHIGKDSVQHRYVNRQQDNASCSLRPQVEQRPPNRPAIYDQQEFQSQSPAYEPFEPWYSSRPYSSATWDRDQRGFHSPYPAQPVRTRWAPYNPTVAAYESGNAGHQPSHHSSFSGNDVVVSYALASAVAAARSAAAIVSSETSASSSSATATSANGLNCDTSCFIDSTVEPRQRPYHGQFTATRTLDTQATSQPDEEGASGRWKTVEHRAAKASLTINTATIPGYSDLVTDLTMTESGARNPILTFDAIEQVLDYCDIIRNLAKSIQKSSSVEETGNGEEEFEHVVADLVAKVGEFHQFVQECHYQQLFG
ncbi:hypothetical protein BJ742DRAFT_446908 [Cladochytrium replicatum]|nr:hypothetical protein BJ742DRAFT_446908 [Cladochytrium replicatum]